jgi:hypothetical protein
MVSRDSVTVAIVALCFIAVVALFGAVIFPALFGHLESLREANSHKQLGFGLTDSERTAWQAVFWVTFAGMLAMAGVVPFLAGRLRGVSNGTLVGTLVVLLSVLAMLSLPLLVFAGGCSDLFTGVSC